MNLEEFKARLKGIYPPIATALTEDEEFDEQGMRRLIRYLLDAGVHGLFVLGTTGESATFTTAQRQRIIEVVVDEVSGKVPVMANVTDIGTKKTIENARIAADSGADAIILMVPYYFTHTAPEVISHFRDVLSAVDLPIFMYNYPFTTNFNMTPDFVGQLAEEDRIVGIKDSSNDFEQFQELLRMFRGSQDFKVFQGEESQLAASILLGADGAVMTANNVAPKLSVEIYEAASAGDIQKASLLQDKLMTAFDILQVSGTLTSGSAIGGVKAALSCLGICGPTVKRPFLPLADEEVNKIKRILEVVSA